MNTVIADGTFAKYSDLLMGLQQDDARGRWPLPVIRSTEDDDGADSTHAAVWPSTRAQTPQNSCATKSVDGVLITPYLECSDGNG
jgi:hypothetical protein